MSGFPTLLYKEVLRFWKVSTQTIAAPALGDDTAAVLLEWLQLNPDEIRHFAESGIVATGSGDEAAR